MSLFTGIRKQLKTSALPLIGLSILVYFTYHILHGERGLLSLWKLQKRVLKAETHVRITNNRKSNLERKVQLLSPTSLDLDMLEERARLMLNYGYPEDVVILDPERKQ